MTRDAHPKSLSPNTRLLIAIAVSALLHLLFIGVWTVNQKSSDAKNSASPQSPTPVAALAPAQMLPQKPADEAPKPKRREIPMIFVETDSSQPSAPPPDTKFYGKQDTVAANPKMDPNKPLGDTPLIEGKQDKVPSVADVPLESSRPSPPPSPPPVPPTPQFQAQPSVEPSHETRNPAEPKTESPKPSDTARAPEEKPQGVEQPKLADGKIIIPTPAPTPARQPQPDTQQPITPSPHQPISPPTSPQPQIALANQPSQQPSPARPAPPSQRQIPARATKMEQSSAPRRGNLSLNVKGTPFGAYDEKLVAAVSRRWHLMLQDKVFGERAGTVVITFILKDDGSVENVRIEEETVGAVLATACVAAIQNSAPFDPFTEEMRAMLGGKHRECKFVFYY